MRDYREVGCGEKRSDRSQKIEDLNLHDSVTNDLRRISILVGKDTVATKAKNCWLLPTFGDSGDVLLTFTSRPISSVGNDDRILLLAAAKLLEHCSYCYIFLLQHNISGSQGIA